MLTLGPLAFASPWILLALLALPLLWFLLRATPPSPRRQHFPANRHLFGLRPKEETPARTPWWLLALRLTIAGLMILALAQPLLNPTAPLGGSGPLVLVIDDGWASAPRWEERERLAESLLSRAERAGRPVLLLTTAPTAEGRSEGPPAPQDAAEVRRSLQALAPKPWRVDRAAVQTRLGALQLQGASEVYWLSDGLDSPESLGLADRLRRLGPLTVVRDPAEALPRILLPPESEGLDLLLRARRIAGGFEETLVVRADDDEGREVVQAELTFEPDAVEAVHRLTLPLELRNRMERLSVEGESSAGATLLLDERWRRRPVGLVTSGAAEGAQPLLGEVYYLERALAPFTEIFRGSLPELLQRRTAVIVLSDGGPGTAAEEEALGAWVEAGGLLLRFAGQRLIDSPADGLLPVRLREGGRSLGGALAWDRAARLAPFPEEGPLAGLVPPPDVVVERQVLAEPSLDLTERTWARLEDGTPLVTAERRGEGWSVLVHTTANAEWSNLALSGLFVEMLQRLVTVSQGVVGGAAESLPPLRLLDGFGRLTPPPPTAQSLPPAGPQDAGTQGVEPGPRHPPGIYGSELARRALNLAPSLEGLRALPALPAGVTERPYLADRERSLLPWLLTAALLLALLDLLIGLALRGLLPSTGGTRRRPGARAAALALALASPLLLSTPGAAQEAGGGEAFALMAAQETRLAYIQTGVPAVDETSRAGLWGLSQMLIRRTTVEPGEPLGLRPGRDDLALFPLIYWPITPEQRDLDEAAQAALNQFLETGGTLLIDLRRPNALDGGFGMGGEHLQRLTRGLQIPPMQPLPPDHVLTRAFYLLQDFPGRFAGGDLWVEESDEHRHDGVATVILGANDWAAAWAVDEIGRPLAAVVPGGERQREMSYRFGINLVMYALTGNYKADQVHVPFILERLGQ